MKKIILLMFVFVCSINSMEEGIVNKQEVVRWIKSIHSIGISPKKHAWLELACGFLEIYKLCQNGGASIYECCNAKNENKRTVLMEETAYHGKKAVMESLIHYGADVNAKDNNGMTALHYASKSSNQEAIKLLIENGVDINAKDNNGCTALHYAATNVGKEEIIIFLLENGAFINSKDNDGMDPLVYAILFNNQKVINIFIKMWCEFNGEGYSESKEFEEFKEEIFKLSAVRNMTWGPNSDLYLKIKEMNSAVEIYRWNE